MCYVGTFQDEEINQQSQLAEKLKQQMLDQEEVSHSRRSQQFYSCEGTPVKTIFTFCFRAPTLTSLSVRN